MGNTRIVVLLETYVEQRKLERAVERAATYVERAATFSWEELERRKLQAELRTAASFSWEELDAIARKLAIASGNPSPFTGYIAHQIQISKLKK